MSSIGTKIKALATQKSLNLKELAEMSGIPYRSLQNYSSGMQLPGVEALLKLRQTFNVDLNWLLDENSEEAVESDEDAHAIDFELYNEVLDVLQNDYLTRNSADSRNLYAKMAAAIYNQVCRINEESKRPAEIHSTLYMLNLQTLEKRLEEWIQEESDHPPADSKKKQLLEKSIGKTKALIKDYQKKLAESRSQKFSE